MTDRKGKLRATLIPDTGTPCTIRFDLRPSSVEGPSTHDVQDGAGPSTDESLHMELSRLCRPLRKKGGDNGKPKRTPSPGQPTLPKKGA